MSNHDELREAWSCANYRAALTCLTAPSSESGRCGFCAAMASVGRAEGVAAATAAVEALCDRYERIWITPDEPPHVTTRQLRTALAALNGGDQPPTLSAHTPGNGPETGPGAPHSPKAAPTTGGEKPSRQIEGDA